MLLIEQYLDNLVKQPHPLGHAEWVRIYDEITVHTQGKRPDKLIMTRRPYEDKGITDYRLESFQPITKDAINRAIQNLQRLFSNAEFRYRVDERIAPYLNASRWADRDFMGWISSVVTRRMIEDPNGAIVYWPSGEGLINPTIEIEIEPILILSRSIRKMDEDGIVWLSNERSEVRFGNKTVRDGNVFYVATKAGFFKYVQYGKKTDEKYKTVPHYIQAFEYAPFVLLQGEQVQIQSENGEEISFYESYFSTYLPFANEAIRQFSDHQGVMVTAAFPIREMQPIECVAEGCRGGFIQDKNTGDRHQCGTCKGTGYIAPPSPYGVLVRPKPSMGEEQSNVPALRYHSPDVAIVEYGEKNWRGLLKDAEHALNLLFIDEAQSGVAKTIDREDKEAAIDRIGSNIYNNIVRNSLIIITDLRVLSSDRFDPQVFLPSTFRIKSEQDIIDELSQLKKDGAPEFIVSEVTRELMTRRYGNAPTMVRMVSLLAEFDPFFSMSTERKRDLYASGAITEAEYLFSLYAPQSLRAISEEAEFMELTGQQIKAALDQRLNPIINRRPLV
jgi:hypothetical protein